MWQWTLLMLVFEGDALVQVWQPAQVTYRTADICHEAGEKFLAYKLPEGRHARALCVDARGEPWIVK